MPRKNTRIQTVLASKKSLPVALIVAEATDTVELISTYIDDTCRVIKATPTKVPLLPCDYMILVDLEDIPSNCETIVKKCSPRVCFVSSAGEDLNENLIKQLQQMRKNSDVRLYTDFLSKELFVRKLFSSSGAFPFIDNSSEAPEVLDEVPVIPKEINSSLQSETQVQVPSMIAASAPLYIQKKKLGTRQPSVLVEKHTHISIGKKTKITSILFLIVIFLTVPLLYTFSNTASGYLRLRAVVNKDSIQELPIEELFAAQSNFKNARTMLTHISHILIPITTTPIYTYADHSVSLGSEISTLLLTARDTMDIGNQFVKHVTDANSVVSPQTTLQALQSKMPDIELHLHLASSHLEIVRAAGILSIPPLASVKSQMDLIQTQMQTAQSILSISHKFFSIIPSFIGIDDSKRYLILFQNNMELRPGGGFIGSYAIADFKKGHLQKLQVEDVYAADGQLKGHVDPPKAISTYLEQPHWYLRDSNFDPDFSTSVEQVEWFLEKETGIKVDGTIAVDLTAVKYILDAIGGIRLADYNETITSENLFLKAQSEIQNDFFPGSTKKKDLLASLARSLVAEFTTSPSLPYISLGHSFIQALDEKHILVSLHDTTTQEFFDESGWNGTLALVQCVESKESCTPDYFTLSEANVGVNKANAYLTRSMEHKLVIEKGHIRRDAYIHYTNTSDSQTFPGGDYRSYIRALIPSGANLESVSIDEQVITPEISPYQDKKSVGFLLTVPPKQQKTVHIVYTLSMIVNASSYQLYMQKQPGTGSDALSISIQSENVSILDTNFALEKTALERYNLPELSARTHNTDLSVDRLFRFTIK